MAAYISGSSVQPDAMQTLYLMNPSYAGYTDSSNTGNMVLISPSTGVGQGNPLTSSSQQQQHYIGPLAQQFPITTFPNSGIGSANLFTSRLGNQAYHSWTEGAELSFLPSNDVTQVNPPSGGRMTTLNPGQGASLLQNGVALGLNMENSQASTGPGQGLSLSLSTQKSSVVQLKPYHMQHSESSISSCAGITHATSDSNTNRGERFPNKWVGNLSSFRASSRDGASGAAFQTSLNAAGGTRQVHLDSSAIGLAGSGALPFVSTYLRAAQQLLVEIVSVGRGLKNSSIKRIKSQSCVGTDPIVEVTVAKCRTLSDSNGKDGIASAIAVPAVASAPEQNTIAVPQLSPVEKQELQMKKAKLMAMLDEVDRRYRQYYNQLQIVVASFEAAAGLGAARTYTALALQTISRNFRCLRDAVSGQVRLTSRSLGDEDIAGQGMVKGETSRLRFVDQQLRQQRALQQLGIMQQHAWRPQRGLPERSVSVLRSWLFEHFLHPYPKDADKIMLARQTGLTRSQVSNWFINARVRLWKPMVEEMYSEESREAEMEAKAEKARQEGENTRQGIGVVDDGAGNGEHNPSLRQTKGDANNRKVAPEPQNASDLAANKIQTRDQNKNMTNSSCDTHIFQENDGLIPGAKKITSSIEDSGQLLSPNISMDANLKSEEARTDDICVPENKLRRESYSTIPHGGLVHSENLGGFGSFHVGGLNRYSQEGLNQRYPGSSGVSLTLGLQHCDGLSLSGAQQYMQGQALQAAGRRHDAGTASDVADFYSVNNQSTGGLTTNYEAINQQNRKRFATHFLRQDFVA